MPSTRRRFLVAVGSAGAAGLAGCSAVDTGPDHPDLDGETLRRVAALGAPRLPSRVPAPIAESFLTASERRARELLSAVPASVSASSIPNEAVRNAVAEARERAVRVLDDAGDARSPYERLRTLRHARGAAARANGTYRAATGDLTEGAVRSRVPPVRDDLRAFRRDHRYVGDDAGRALVAHATVERLAQVADNYLDHVWDRGRYDSGAPLVGGALSSVESARASVEGARHVADGFESSLSRRRDYGPTFRDAAASLASVTDARVGDYPDDHQSFLDGFDRDLRGTPAYELLVESFAGMDRGVAEARTHRAAGRFARSLLAAHDVEAHRRALAAASRAVRDGDYVALRDAAAVRDAKLGALEAVEAARTDPSHPVVTRDAVVDVAYRVGRGDDYLDRGSGGDTYQSATDATGQYAYAAHVARELPGTSAWLLGAVRATSTGADAS